MALSLAQTNHILDELLPQETKSTEGIAKFTIVSDGDDTGVEVVADLNTHVILYFFVEDVGVRHHEVVKRSTLLFYKVFMGLERLLKRAMTACNLVPGHSWGVL